MILIKDADLTVRTMIDDCSIGNGTRTNNEQ